MFTFDSIGNSLSIPNGLQNYHEGMNYYFMITTTVPSTGQIANVTYTISLTLPSGLNPLPSIQLVIFFK